MAAKGGLVGIHSNAGFLSQEFLDDMIRPPSGDYGKYIAALAAEMRENWNRDFGAPWQEKQQQTVDAGGPLATEKDWAAHVDYVVNLVGEDYIGIGMDMMDGGRNIRDFDATSYPRLTEALVDRGYAPERIRKILGENWLRALDAAQSPQ